MPSFFLPGKRLCWVSLRRWRDGAVDSRATDDPSGGHTTRAVANTAAVGSGSPIRGDALATTVWQATVDLLGWLMAVAAPPTRDVSRETTALGADASRRDPPTDFNGNSKMYRNSERWKIR